jgi:hypothetical protein
MNKRLLIGIIVIGVVSIGLVIAGVIIKPAFITLGVGVAVIGFWIYLVWMVWRKKANIFPDEMEPKSAESRLKRLKVFLLVSGISLVVGIVGVIVHNVIFAVSEVEESVFFSIGLAGLLVFVIATIGGLVIFLTGRRKQAKGLPE